VFANGIRPSTNPYYGLLGAQLICSDSFNPARFAGPLPNDQPEYTATPLSCGAGEVMVGVHGSTGVQFGYRVVDNIGPQCQPIGGGEVNNVPAAGGGFGPHDAFNLSCPSAPTQQAVTGVVGGVGEVVDSIALVCATTSSTPTIASASPATLAAFQYVTLVGNNLPATGMSDVLFSQGDFQYTADYVWFASSSLVVARVPTGVLTNGAATVRLKNPGSTVFTNSVPVTIAGTPGAPVLLNIYSSWVGGTATTTLNPGQQFLIEADGTGSAYTTFHWTQGATTISVGATSTSGGPTGRVGTQGTVPAAVTTGTWTLTVTTATPSGVESARSNGISVTIAPMFQ
jgi:hypothetical protein